jgi:hypothetical protein
MSLLLEAIFPSFMRMENTLPASAAITTKDLIGFLVFSAIYTPILWIIKPQQLRLGLYLAFIMTFATFVGIMPWALVANGGPGELIAPVIPITTSQKAFRFIQCVSSISGTWEVQVIGIRIIHVLKGREVFRFQVYLHCQLWWYLVLCSAHLRSLRQQSFMDLLSGTLSCFSSIPKRSIIP